MIFTNILKKFKEKEKVFSVYDNKNFDDSKDKTNALIYFLVQYIQDIQASEQLSNEYKQYMEKVFDYNKDVIIMYLRLALDVMDNQNFNQNELNKETFSTLIDFNGNLDISTLKGKIIILSQIRNAFAHKTGKMQFLEENGINKVKIENKGWFSIKIDVKELNSIFKSIMVEDPEKNIQEIMIKTIDCIENKQYEKTPRNADILILMNLLMCYNKESIFDQFMATQSSFIDASNFAINTTSNWGDTEEKLRNQFFDKFEIFFHSKKDKDLYDAEWKSTVDIATSVVISGLKYRYDTDSMPYDSYIGKHIPIPIALLHLRNANSHGRINLNGDDFQFFDKGNDPAANPYFFMTISRTELLRFLQNDYFQESLLATMDNHREAQNKELYLLEEVEAANEFSNFIDIYISRLSNMTIEQVIKYMYDNNKFSSYLMENPGQVLPFINYKLEDGSLLIEKIATIEGKTKDNFRELILNPEFEKKSLSEYLKKGLSLYSDFCKEKTKSNNSFFEKYYSHIRNSRNFLPNIRYKDLDDLIDEDRKIIVDGGKALREEYEENDTFIDNSEESYRMLVELGMQMSDTSELEKIAEACLLGKFGKKLSETEEIEGKRYNITNINKHYTLAQVHANSAEQNLEYSMNRRKTLAKIFAVNVGVRLFNAGYVYLGMKEQWVDPSLILMTYPTSIFLCNLAISKSWRNLRNNETDILKYNEIIEEYSETPSNKRR